MGLDVGIVGLPNVGKSTLFNLLTQKGVPAENYPFCTIEPNVGVSTVADSRLDDLAKIFNSKQLIYNVVRLVDIAGLIKGAANGEGLGNKFLEKISAVDAILQVVRCFVDDDIVHVTGSVDPLRDIQLINAELILADLAKVERRLATEKKRPDKKALVQVLGDLAEHLSSGRLARSFVWPEVFAEDCNELGLLTTKPLIYLLNFAEQDINKTDELTAKVEAIAKDQGAKVIKAPIKLCAEIDSLPKAEQKLLWNASDWRNQGLDEIVQNCFRALNQVSFFTAGEKEARAWNVTKAAFLPQAAGRIHSDMERGFIRGEVYDYEDLIATGSLEKLKAAGKLRIEGRDYRIVDGDVVNIRFKV